MRRWFYDIIEDRICKVGGKMKVLVMNCSPVRMGQQQKLLK